MDYNPIKRLKLKEVFDNHQKFQEITCDQDYLTSLFEWTNRGIIFIHDDASSGHSIFITDTKGLGTDKTFKINNTHHLDLFLWHIDGVLFKKDSKCDCAFLTGRYIGFVEFKSNAINSTEISIKENYNKAISQLRNTIDDINEKCKKVGIDLIKDSIVEAYAVFNRTVPKLNAYQKKLAASFLYETGGVPLYFKNSIEI